jgi:hypothetical protein
MRDEGGHKGDSEAVGLDAAGVSKGYEVTHIDELDELPVNQGEFAW